MSGQYRVLVTQSPEQWAAWMGAVQPEPGENPFTARVRRIEATGETLIQFTAGGFDWICPGCGALLGGLLADGPVSGWDAPRWVKTGTPERPTLTPSLGCPRWRRGECIGHWWLRDGILVTA